MHAVEKIKSIDNLVAVYLPRLILSDMAEYRVAGHFGPNKSVCIRFQNGLMMSADPYITIDYFPHNAACMLSTTE